MRNSKVLGPQIFWALCGRTGRTTVGLGLLMGVCCSPKGFMCNVVGSGFSDKLDQISPFKFNTKHAALLWVLKKKN
jgi:hypothetical protein